MADLSFTISSTIPATPADVYAAWLDSDRHTAMTGGEAEVSDQPGGAFTAWGGYISGKNIELETDNRIVQSWRTTEFENQEPDSHLEVILEAVPEGTRITLSHTGLPAHGMQYKQGWVDHYFEPMKTYFED